MEKQVINCRRSRALREINTHGGRVTGYARNRSVPVVYAIAPRGGNIWPVREVLEVVGGVRQRVRTSVIEGCTVIWGKYDGSYYSKNSGVKWRDGDNR